MTFLSLVRCGPVQPLVFKCNLVLLQTSNHQTSCALHATKQWKISRSKYVSLNKVSIKIYILQRIQCATLLVFIYPSIQLFLDFGKEAYYYLQWCFDTYMLLFVFVLTSSWFWFLFLFLFWSWSCHLHMSSQTKPHAVPSRRLGSSRCSCNDRVETSIRVVSGWRLGSTPQPDASGGPETKRVAPWL